MSEFVQVYDSQSDAYRRAFQIFLAHTNEKTVIHSWLTRLVGGLPTRELLIDAGAGSGQLTATLLPWFRRTIAIEPSPYLREPLQQNCPQAEVLTTTIRAAQPGDAGDLVLCSHVLYYIDEAEWLAQLECLASWLASGGVLAVILQSPDCGCTELLAHFTGKRPSLPHLADSFRRVHTGRYVVDLKHAAAVVQAPKLDTAYTIAEFMLNLYPLPQPVPRSAVEAYLRHYGQCTSGGYRLSLAQIS